MDATDPVRSLPEKYELLDTLSHGGMGAVLKVRHRHLDEVQVVKVILPQLAGNEELRERFLREARVAVQLRHPHVAQVYDLTVTDDGVAYLGMEFIEGTDLAAVRRARSLEVAEVLDIARQALGALEYLHRKGFVHRDISPENLMLTEGFDGQPLVKLIDLGIAKHLEQDSGLTREGMFVGKVRYAAPEQFSGEPVDPASDLYSLGVVLYELATGRHPVRGKTTEEIIAGHLMRGPVPFAESDPAGRVPPAVRAVLERALCRAKEDRFASAAEFAEALEEAATEEPPEPTRLGAAPVVADATQLLPAHEAAPAAGTEPTRLDSGVSTNAETMLQAPPASTAEPTQAGEAARGRLRVAWPLAALVAVALGGLGYWIFARDPAPVAPSPVGEREVVESPDPAGDAGVPASDPLADLVRNATDEGLEITAPTDVVALGEPISLDLRSDAPGHLLVLAQDATGDLALLYPNSFRPLPQVGAGASSLPFVEDVDRGYRLHASEPLGRQRVVVLRSERPPELAGVALGEGAWLTAFPASGPTASANALMAAVAASTSQGRYAAAEVEFTVAAARE